MEIAELHTTLLGNAYGKASEILKEFILWIQQNTPIRVLKGMCGMNNELAKKFIERNGFERIGVSDQTWKIGEEVVHFYDYERELGGV